MSSSARRGGRRPAKWDDGGVSPGIGSSPASLPREKVLDPLSGVLSFSANGFRAQAAVKQKPELATKVGRATRAPLFLGAMIRPTPFVLLAAFLALAACVRQGAPAPVVHSSGGGTAAAAPASAVAAVARMGTSAENPIVVRQGESLYAVAQRAGVPVRSLIDANDLKPPYAVSRGQRLNVPRQAMHEVQPGDTLARIARRYGVGTNELVRANALPPPYAVHAGQILRLPGGVEPVVAGVTPNPASSLATPPPSPLASAAPPPAPMERAPRGVVESAALPPPSTTAAAPAAPAASAPEAASAVAASSVPPALPAPTPVATLPTPAPVMTPPPSPIQPVSLPVPASPLSRADTDDDEPAAGRPGRGFLWPVRGGSVISDYGAKPGGLQNDGINIAAPRGASIRAADAGSVVYAGNELRGFGNLLLVRHRDGWITAYAHADELLVKRGDTVIRGQTIARVGSTGGVSSPQLHFEIRRGSRPLNPRDYLAPQTASATP